MFYCSRHFLSKISAHRYPGDRRLDSFMLFSAGLAGSLEQTLPKRGEPMI